MGQLGGSEAKYEENKTGISTEKGYFESNEKITEESLNVGPIQINDKKKSAAASFEAGGLLIGVGAVIGVDVYTETYKMQKVRDGIEGEEKRVYSDR